MTRSRLGLSFVVAAALVGCGAEPVVPGSPTVATFSPTATAAPSVTATDDPLPAWTWTSGTLDTDDPGAVTAIFPLAGGFSAVATRTWSDADERQRATFLVSADGVAWRETPFPRERFSYELGVIHGDQLSIFGSTGPATSPEREVWQTTDGVAWTQLEGVSGLDFGPGSMRSAAPAEAGWLAVGTEVIDPEHQVSHLLTSPDLRRWRELPWPDGVEDDGIASDGTTWAMLGMTFSRDLSGPFPLRVFRSADGETWTSSLVADVPKYDSGGSIAATSRGGWAIGGQRFDPADESSNPIAWWSADGLIWQSAEVVRVDGLAGQANMSHLAAFEEGLLATGHGDEEQVGLWMTDDGRRWTQVTPVPDGLTQVDAAARVGGDVIVSGWTGEAPQHIWRGTPAP